MELFTRGRLGQLDLMISIFPEDLGHRDRINSIIEWCDINPLEHIESEKSLIQKIVWIFMLNHTKTNFST